MTAVGELARRPTGERVVVVAVPGTPQETLLDRPLTQRPALVRTVVVQGAEGAAAPGQRDAPAVDGHASHPGLSRNVDRIGRRARHPCAPLTLCFLAMTRNASSGW